MQQKVAQITTDHSTVKTTYFHNDLLGSPIAATDAEGNLLWKEYYQPFGSRWNKTVGKDNTQWFTGKTFDNLTELEYFGARYYDPIWDRFMGMDPIGFAQNHPRPNNWED